MITQARLQELLDYREDGCFVWKVNLRGRFARIGRVAGTKRPDGYISISLDQNRYLAHRLVWLWHSGVMPDAEIDHINGIKHDNRIENIRQATRIENLQNIRKSKSKHTGLLGASYSMRDKSYSASIRHNGVKIHLGSFATAMDAHNAYLKAKKSLHPFSV